MNMYRKYIAVITMITFMISIINVHALTLYSNGNVIEDVSEADEGIITAVSDDNAYLAIAKYKDGSLVSLDFSAPEDGLSSHRVSAVINSESPYDVKIFQFNSSLMPLEKEIIPSANKNDIKIYFNETFDNGSGRVNFDGETFVLSDGKAIINNDGTSGGPRFGVFSVNYPDKNVIVEADYTLPSDGAPTSVLLMTIYNGGPLTCAYLDSQGLKPSTSGKNNPPLVPRAEIKSDGSFKISIKMDFENFCYDLYYNRKKVTASPRSLSNYISSDGRYDGFSMHIPIVKSQGTICVDNIKAYSGTEFTDIGKQIANVHEIDVKSSPNWKTDIYERPDGVEIAEKVLCSEHPRILLTKERVNIIKNAKKGRIATWRDAILPVAEAYLDTPVYSYKPSSTDSIENTRDAISLFMHLGLAYQLTGDMRYPDRAYKELEVIYDVAGRQITPNGGKDYWNSYSYLNVAELSYALSVCYDWMYDAWTPAQRQEICDNITKRSLDRAYRSLYGYLTPDSYGDLSWWKSTNNWNGVCNGTAIVTALAFMETDPYKCSEIVEGCLRGFEYLLPDFAPMGAWTEGVGYWSYALTYLSVSCAALDYLCGTDYGIHKTTGLENSMFYAISNEGKTGVISFGDAASNHVHAPFMFYWAKKFQNPQIGGAALYSLDKFNFEPNIYDLLYYDESYVTEDYVQPLSSYYKGTEVVRFSQGYDDNGTTIAITGGKGVDTSHDHIDSGSIIVEKNGIRVISDTGAEHYGAPSYFSTNRYWYYKARPEGHNIFVINPENLTNGETTDKNGNIVPVYYHGQDVNAVSKITHYDSEKQEASMDLTDAYSRDAKKCVRKIYFEEDRTVIEDEITLKSDGSTIEWYYHFPDLATAVVNGSTKTSNGYCTYEIGDSGNYVILTFNDYTYDRGFIYSGKSKKFFVSFLANADFEVEVRDAVRNPYDANVVEQMRASGKLGIDYFRSINLFSKIVVKMKNASGTVNLKAVLE